MSKFIFVTGGVVSGLGKGITAASLGRLLKGRGLKVASQKLDPYMNVDPGTMSPLQHGEVFVTEDGTETDLDLGHYERFIDEDLNKYSNLTSGKVYWNVLSKERKGEYLGQTVQIIPHVTNEIKRFIYSLSEKTQADVVITEVGGTVGDIESQPFLEAIRQVGLEVGKENRLYIHVTLVPYLASSREHKSKPTQQSVNLMQGLGIFPDIIVTRSDEPIEHSIKEKIALFCNVKPQCVIENTTLDSLYKVPLMLQEQKMDLIVCQSLNLPTNESDITAWNDMIYKLNNPKKEVCIGMLGKYTALHDAYLSVIEALHHSGIQNFLQVKLKWIESSDIVDLTSAGNRLSDCDGILVPGGFGERGIEGMIIGARYARENGVPYFGICLGMQVAVIEYARNVLFLSDADSGEFKPEIKHRVIDLMPDQSGNIPKGGTMRLGSYPLAIKENSLLQSLYGSLTGKERHRHRYEFSNAYRDAFQKAGMVISGTSPDGNLVEAVELPQSVHPFYVGVQFHPEFKSRPTKTHPIFDGFIQAAERRMEVCPK